MRKTHFEFRAALDAAMIRQADLARLCGVTARQVSNWFQGRAEVPRYAWAILACLAGVERSKIRSGEWPAFTIRRHHVFRTGDTYKSLAKKFHPDLSRRDTLAEMQIVNRFK